jgi:hypothetical protein
MKKRNRSRFALRSQGTQMTKFTHSIFPNDSIGILPNGKLNIVNADDPPFRPIVVDERGRVIEPDDDRLVDVPSPTHRSR